MLFACCFYTMLFACCRPSAVECAPALLARAAAAATHMAGPPYVSNVHGHVVATAMAVAATR